MSDTRITLLGLEAVAADRQARNYRHARDKLAQECYTLATGKPLPEVVCERRTQ